MMFPASFPSSTRSLYRPKNISVPVHEFGRSWVFGTERRFLSRTGKRPVLTLRPERMEAIGQKVADISGMRMPIFYMVSPHPTTSSRILRTVYKAVQGSATQQPFPDGTKGVLYYHQPGLSKLSGGLRFRVCPDVAHFSEGKDLETQVGDPWHIPLYNLIRAKFWKSYSTILLRERLVKDDLVSDIMKLPPFGKSLKARLLYEINQPFVLDLQQPAFSLVFMNRKNLFTIVLQYITEDRRSYPGFQPYEGRILVKFELSNLKAHLKTPTLTLRVLEELTPVRCVVPGNYDLFVAPPKPGQLLSKKALSGKDYKPWTLPLTVRSSARRRIADFLELPQEHNPPP